MVKKYFKINLSRNTFISRHTDRLSGYVLELNNCYGNKSWKRSLYLYSMTYWNPLLHSQWFLDLTQFRSQKHIFLSGKQYSRKLFICRQRNIWETLAKVKWMVTCFSVHVEVRSIGCEFIFDCKLNRSLLGGCQCSWIFKVLRVWFGWV